MIYQWGKGRPNKARGTTRRPIDGSFTDDRQRERPALL